MPLGEDMARVRLIMGSFARGEAWRSAASLRAVKPARAARGSVRPIAMNTEDPCGRPAPQGIPAAGPRALHGN